MQPTLPCTVRHFDGGGCAAIVFGSIAGLILTAGMRGVAVVAGLPVEPMVAAGAGVAALMMVGMTFFFSTDTVAVVDREGMKLTVQRRLGPLRGGVQTLLETRWSDGAKVVDVTEVRITANRGAQKYFRLRVGKVTIESAQFGTGSRDGKYLELIEAIRAAIGDRLEEKADLGDLEDVVRKVANTPPRQP